MKLVLAVAASAIALGASAAQAGVIYASPAGVDVNGVTTPDLTSVATPSVGIFASFDPRPENGGGVVVDEVDQSTGWHDSQIEVEADGHVRVSMWYYGNVGALDLGLATFGANNTVAVNYDNATGVLSGRLNGGALISHTSYPGSRSTPVQSNYTQYYAFGRGDGTNLGNGAPFVGSITNVVITDGSGGAVPEPASWALMILGVSFTGAALRRRAPATA